MGKIIAVVDSEQYFQRKGGICIIQGWKASKEAGDIQIQVRADSEPVEYEVRVMPRPDVFRVYPDLDCSDTNIGYRIVIKNMEELMRKYEAIRIRLVQGEETFPLWKCTRAAFKEKYRESKIQYRLDCAQLDGDQVKIHGWCVGSSDNYEVLVTDEHGQQISCIYNKKFVYHDINRELDLPDDCKSGFMVAVERKNIQGSQMRLKFSDGVSAKEEVIDMKAFDRRNSIPYKTVKELGRANLARNRQLIRSRGWLGFVDYIKDGVLSESQRYMYYLKKQTPSERELRKQAKTKFPYMPKISIVVPLYNTPQDYLREMIDSIQKQSYQNWELCLADGSTEESTGRFVREHYRKDSRIRYRKVLKNEGISGNTNCAMEMATGEFIMFCDHDDVVMRNALYELVAELNRHQDTDIIYTDEDLMNGDGTVYSSPRFKPDFNFDFLRSINYICHIFLVRKTLVDQVGMLRKELDGAQDYDFVLRCCEKTDKIRHIPKILYHWRAHENSTAGNPESKEYAIKAAVRSLEEHYQRMGIDAEVIYTGIFILLRTVMKVQGNPLVSILIPNKDHIEDLETCIRSVQEKSTYQNFEIIVIENNSEQEETFSYYQELEQRYQNVRVVRWEGPFNYSAINNFGAKHAKGEFFVLMNNDIAVMTPQWMEEMLGFCQRKNTGIVGAKLYYGDDTVQHAGVVVGLGGFAGHVLTRAEREDAGYFGRLAATQEISAVTAACLMIKRDIYEKIGGFDESFVVALNDIDLCLKVRALDQLVVFHPYAEMHHYESKSRGMEDTPEKRERFKGEIARFRRKWKSILENGDPYYNVNLSLERGDCSLRSSREHFEIVEEIEKGNK